MGIFGNDEEIKREQAWLWTDPEGRPIEGVGDFITMQEEGEKESN